MLMSRLNDRGLQLETGNWDRVGGKLERATVLLHQLDVVGAILLVAGHKVMRSVHGQLWPSFDECYEL